jgi:hypothetical protein
MEEGNCVEKVHPRTIMKISHNLIGFAVLMVGAGCQSSNHPAVSSTTTTRQTVRTTASEAPAPETGSEVKTVQQGSIGNVDYTIQMIPNTRLSATSREGDKATEVYSSNIIAVYVQPHQGVKVSSTNAPIVPVAATK